MVLGSVAPFLTQNTDSILALQPVQMELPSDRGEADRSPGLTCAKIYGTPPSVHVLVVGALSR